MSQNREGDRDRLERHLESELRKRGMTRRELMKGGAGLAGAVGLGWLFAACGGGGGETTAAGTTEPPAGTTAAGTTEAPPTTEEAPPAEAFTGTLKVTGLGVDLIDPVKAAGEAALGFPLAFDVTDSVTMVQKAITQPDAFDVFSGYTYQFNQIWPSGNMYPLEIAQIPLWGEMSSLIKQGKVDPASSTCVYGDGDAPFRSLYVDVDGTGQWPSSSETPVELEGVLVSWVDEETGQTVGDEPAYTIGTAHNFNMDAMGYNTDVIQMEPEEVDWTELLNASWKGRVAILNDPGIGMQDVGVAAVTLGLMERPASFGNLTKDEIDTLVKILLDYKKKGQFKAFWTTFNDSVNFMASGEVVIESMWSPAVALLVAQGQPIRYAAPPSGFRGWAATMGISSKAAEDPAKLQACYDYINWWFSGEPGAIMMRQGYYNGVQETSREFVEPEEWDFWIEGQPAAKDLPGITGNVGDIKAGQVRDGGSFTDRACNYATWNSYFDENEYQVQRWNEFLNA
ncbi:MAG: extracellular solute-binding protein [Gaiellales bacterium]